MLIFYLLSNFKKLFLNKTIKLPIKLLAIEYSSNVRLSKACTIIARDFRKYILSLKDLTLYGPNCFFIVFFWDIT